jgi:hypothetical protein
LVVLAISSQRDTTVAPFGGGDPPQPAPVINVSATRATARRAGRIMAMPS